MTAAHRAAVLGSPIAHSLSPVLHRAAYAELGLADWRYDRFEVDAAALPGWLGTLADGEGWVGLSLTMPLKKAVIGLLGSISPLAAAVGAVNTVLFEPGSARADRARGENTDVHGIVAALASAGVAAGGREPAVGGQEAAAGGPEPAARGQEPAAGGPEPAARGQEPAALVLGAGATAASSVAALAELGCREPLVAARSRARAQDVLLAAERLGGAVRLLDLAQLGPAEPGQGLDGAPAVVISTLPGGAADELAEPLARRLAGGAVLLDVVYANWPTPLAAAWQRHGGTVVSGFTMLLHQAAAQVELMTGRPAPIEAMRAAAEPHVGAAARR